MLLFPYRSTHRSSDCDETSISFCKQGRGGFVNLKSLKIVLAGVSGVPGVHSDLDEILHSLSSKKEESQYLHDHPAFPSLLIATGVWTKFGKSMLRTWTAVCGLLRRRKIF